MEERLHEFREVGGAMILERHIHGLPDGKRHIGWSGNRECFKSNHDVLRDDGLRLSQPGFEGTKISVVVFVVNLTKVFFVIL